MGLFFHISSTTKNTVLEFPIRKAYRPSKKKLSIRRCQATTVHYKKKSTYLLRITLSYHRWRSRWKFRTNLFAIIVICVFRVNYIISTRIWIFFFFYHTICLFMQNVTLVRCIFKKIFYRFIYNVLNQKQFALLTRALNANAKQNEH